jgi:hypothetical protein
MPSFLRELPFINETEAAEQEKVFSSPSLSISCLSIPSLSVSPHLYSALVLFNILNQFFFFFFKFKALYKKAAKSSICRRIRRKNYSSTRISQTNSKYLYLFNLIPFLLFSFLVVMSFIIFIFYFNRYCVYFRQWLSHRPAQANSRKTRSVSSLYSLSLRLTLSNPLPTLSLPLPLFSPSHAL